MLEDWEPLSPVSMNLVTALIATPQFFDGMATCLSLLTGGHDKDVTLEKVMKMIEGETGNPALHAFWDIWQDGQDGIIDGAELPRLMAGGILSEECEKLCLNPGELSRKTINFMQCEAQVSYRIIFIRIYDWEAMGDKTLPALWPSGRLCFSSGILDTCKYSDCHNIL